MAPGSCAPLLHSSIAALRDCLYLTSDRRLAPLPFPVARQPCSWPRRRKDDAGGQYRQRFYPERAVLCATCVTVAVVTIAEILWLTKNSDGNTVTDFSRIWRAPSLPQ
jgi:hypothetical protein